MRPGADCTSASKRCCLSAVSTETCENAAGSEVRGRGVGVFSWKMWEKKRTHRGIHMQNSHVQTEWYPPPAHTHIRIRTLAVKGVCHSRGAAADFPAWKRWESAGTISQPVTSLFQLSTKSHRYGFLLELMLIINTKNIWNYTFKKTSLESQLKIKEWEGFCIFILSSTFGNAVKFASQIQIIRMSRCDLLLQRKLSCSCLQI